MDGTIAWLEQHGFDKILDCVGLPLSADFHIPAVQIAHITLDPILLGVPFYCRTETDSLYISRNRKMDFLDQASLSAKRDS